MNITHAIRITPRTLPLLLTAFGILLISCKRDKLVDSSAQARPAWAFGIEPQAVIVAAEGRTHDEAREKAFTAVKESIVNAVAVNVSSTVQLKVTEQVINDVRQFRERTEINTRVSGTFLNSLRGIHINKATDWYWELRRTPEKERYVVYHLKYPFAENELAAYVREWEALDSELNAELQNLNARADQSRDVHELVTLKTEAERLSEIFSEPRRSLAANTASRIRQKLENLRFEVIEHSRGELLIALRSNGNLLRAAAPPRFRSDCAQLEELQFSESDGHYLLHYDVAFCDRPDQNLVLTAEAGSRELSMRIPIPDDPDHVRLKIAGTLFLHRISGDLREWQLPLRILSKDTVEVSEIEISLERRSGRLLAALSRRGREGLYTHIRQSLDEHLQGSGDYLLRFSASHITNEADEIFTSLFNNSEVYKASGRISYRKQGTEAWRQLRFESLSVSMR